MEKQHKLAAIMFTDIVDYSALMAKDEQNALRILEKNRDTLKHHIMQFNGEWLKEMGDGSLSIFPSIMDVVNCALKIQNSLKNESDFSIRIGIHIGDVVVEGGDVFGDGVNVASRIEKVAEPGGICVSGQVYANIRNKRDIEAILLGEKTFKNIDNAITVYALAKKSAHEKPTSSQHAKQVTHKNSKPSIAVLPFRDMSPEKDQEWFCNGIADEIINALTHIEGLHVAALTSTLSSKEKHEDIREIGRRLNVESVLEGSVRKANNKLRITAQLIKVADGYHLWSECYDRNMEDVFEIQDEISLTVVKELKIQLLGEEKDAIVKHHTKNLEAYNLYLKGSYHANKRDEVDLKKAIEYFKKALDIDPEYAMAYARLADSYLHLAAYSDVPAEAYTKAKEAALKALDIDDKLAEAHAALAGIKMDHEWDWAGAEKEYRRSQELDPLLLSIYKFTMGVFNSLRRIDEAIELSHKASEIDPDFRRVYETIISLNCKQENYDGAFEAHRKMIEITGSCDAWGKAQLGYIYGMTGEKDNAEEILNDLIKRRNEEFPLSLRKAYVCSGLEVDDKAEKALKELEENENIEYIPALSIALLYLSLGEHEKVFEWLDKAYEEFNTLMMFIETVPKLKKMRLDERFKALLKKI